jgi:hypothetical protein
VAAAARKVQRTRAASSSKPKALEAILLNPLAERQRPGWLLL